MATNKHATIRYQALDKCFRNTGRKYFIDDLIEACNQAIFDYNGSIDGVKKRQVQEDINFMQSESGYGVELIKVRENRKVYYRYDDPNFSINNQPLNAQEETQLREAILTLNRFKGMPQFEWMDELTVKLESELGLNKSDKKIIEFEQNPYLLGLENISILYNAILHKQSLSVDYKSFKSEKTNQFIFSPHFLKQYNNRWFVLGVQDGYTNSSTLALDRIEHIESSPSSYFDSQIDFEEHFDDVIGVTIPTDTALEIIKIKIDAILFPYIKSKPLHGSQKIKETNKEYSLIELNLIPNYELETTLLSHGEKLTVLEPKSLSERIQQRLKNGYKNY